MQVAIRKASTQDIPKIEELLRTTALSSDGLQQFIQNFHVAEADGRIIGTIGLEVYSTTGLLRSAAVLPEFQSHGIGDRLVTALVQEAIDLGLHELVLMTTTAETYFTRKGFVAVQRDTIRGNIVQSSQFQGGCPSTAVSMRRSLVGA